MRAWSKFLEVWRDGTKTHFFYSSSSQTDTRYETKAKGHSKYNLLSSRSRQMLTPSQRHTGSFQVLPMWACPVRHEVESRKQNKHPGATSTHRLSSVLPPTGRRAEWQNDPSSLGQRTKEQRGCLNSISFHMPSAPLRSYCCHFYETWFQPLGYPEQGLPACLPLFQSQPSQDLMCSPSHH